MRLSSSISARIALCPTSASWAACRSVPKRESWVGGGGGARAWGG